MAMPDLGVRRFVVEYKHRSQQKPAGKLHVWSVVLDFDGEHYANHLNLKKLLDKAIPVGAGSDLQKHRTGGCGEINCVAVWEKLFGSNDSLADSLIVTCRHISHNEPERIPPCCRGDGSWGCKEFLDANQIKPIEPEEPGKPLPAFRERTHPEF